MSPTPVRKLPDANILSLPTDSQNPGRANPKLPTVTLDGLSVGL